MSLYENIHLKKKRIAEGSEETMRKKGDKGAPTDQDFKKSEKTAKKPKGYKVIKKKKKTGY